MENFRKLLWVALLVGVGLVGYGLEVSQFLIRA